MNDRQQGFTLIELMVGLGLLIIGVLSFAVQWTGTIQLAGDSRAHTMAKVALRNITELMRATPMESVSAEFGPGSGRESFWCSSDGTIVFMAPDNALVRGDIEIFDVESDVPETFAGAVGGLDLDGDGVIGTAPLSEFECLPVRIRMTITTAHGEREVVADHVLGSTGD